MLPSRPSFLPRHGKRGLVFRQRRFGADPGRIPDIAEHGRAFAEAHELSFDILIVLAGVHVGAIAFHLFYDRNNLTRPMLSGRKRVAGEVEGMKRAPVWRLWTGVALATLVVWIVVKE